MVTQACLSSGYGVCYIILYLSTRGDDLSYKVLHAFPELRSILQISTGNLPFEMGLPSSVWRRCVCGGIQWVTIDTHSFLLFSFFPIALMHGITTFELVIFLFQLVIPFVPCILLRAPISISFSNYQTRSHWFFPLTKSFNSQFHFPSLTLFPSFVSIGLFNTKFIRRELSPLWKKGKFL